MKKAITIITISIISLVQGMAQTIRRVNNNPGITGVNVYATPQLAHDAAAMNDIIYLEPSTATYGNLKVTKPLKIYGPGYFLDKVVNGPQETRIATLSSLDFENGSTNSTVSGVTINQIYIRDNNITVNRCDISGISFTVSTLPVGGPYTRGNFGNLLSNNISGSVTGSNSATPSNQYGYNCLISNNIFYGSINTLTSTAINNNTFAYWPYGGASLSNLYGCTVSNNIMDARTIGSAVVFVNGGIGNSISNNICLGQSATPGGNGNVNNGDPLNTFIVANPWTTVTTEDSKFQLKVGSPAIGIGTGGIDAGAFGGPSPYILSGLPAVPIITSFSASAVGNSTAPLNVTVGARSNN